jgi:hypothetical protein|tara:strand:- start:812 stop:1495 length:684 start_codon:yes stop_codon:yes gene_type:complete
MKILITGCSWVQRMHKQKYPKDIDIDLKSFGGQGLWRIKQHFKIVNTDIYDYIFIQLPTPIRNDADSFSTSDKFRQFLKAIEEMGEDVASEKWLADYRKKILEINEMHDNIVFFLYNNGGYPLRHPYDFGEDADKEMIDFLEKSNLNHIYLSFEGKPGYGLKEDKCDDDEFWDYYHRNNPMNSTSEMFKKYWHIVSPKGWISLDPHPNETANKEALDIICYYVRGSE